MFLNLLKHYLRVISRRKLFSFINITGLAFGIAFVILIGQFVYYEFNYNSSLKNVDNIFRVVDADRKDYNVDYRLKDKVLESIPGIKNSCLLNNFSIDAETGNKLFRLKHMLMVDANFFDVFNIKFLSGNPKLALSAINNVILTESTAKRIFGTLDVAGKTLRLNHHIDMIVTGVVKDLPKNLSFDAEIFVNYSNSPEQKLPYREMSSNNKSKFLFSMFLELEKIVDKATVENQISALNKIDGFVYPKHIILAPLSSDYFNVDYNDSDLMHGNAGLVKLLSIIGIIVLTLAIINYINLTTASYKYRLKEFGVKKCLGADRKSLIKQLSSESLFTTIISSFLGIILASLFLPYFNQFVDKTLTLLIFTDLRFLLLFITFILLLSFLISIVPSLVLLKISALQLFKVNPSFHGGSKAFRNVLTMFQFSIAIILIAGLIVISKQINYAKYKNVGFNTDQLMYLKIDFTLKDRIQVLTDKLQQYSGIKSLTKTLGMPGSINLMLNSYDAMAIDSNSLKTFGLKILKGRNILPSDINKAVIINETALKQLKDKNWEDKKIGGWNILGIVSDFSYSSVHQKIGPFLMAYCDFMPPDVITMRFTGPISEAVSYINKTWKEVCPDYQEELGFYDEYFASMYKKEENLASIVSIFSILAIIISSMGIFGLSVFQSEQRIKEIGIRKVLGATVPEIFGLLTKNFSSWVILANIIAVPVSYYLMSKWLEDFAFKIGLSWWIFALSGGIALLIALITISINTIKAAIADPINALRYE